MGRCSLEQHKNGIWAAAKERNREIVEDKGAYSVETDNKAVTAAAHPSPLINMEEWQRATEEGIEQEGGGCCVCCWLCWARDEGEAQ